MAVSVDAKITILTCLEERPTFGLFKTKTSHDEYEKEKKLVEREHKNLGDLASKRNVKCESKVIRSSIASRGIISYAKEHDVDLIIMSKTRPHMHMERLHYWSTIENVFRNSPCPLLIL